MNCNKNGIPLQIPRAKEAVRKVFGTKVSSEQGKLHITDVPTKLYEFTKRDDDFTLVTIFTPFTEDGKALREEGFQYVATHDVSQ